MLLGVHEAREHLLRDVRWSRHISRNIPSRWTRGRPRCDKVSRRLGWRTLRDMEAVTPVLPLAGVRYYVTHKPRGSLLSTN